MTDDKTICAVCAWRQDCLKRFRYESSNQLRCPDYTRDMTIKAQDGDDEGERK
ncbi:MAG: hypothetical protein V1816_17575 [Pseudomonadota bacterium]